MISVSQEIGWNKILGTCRSPHHPLRHIFKNGQKIHNYYFAKIFLHYETRILPKWSSNWKFSSTKYALVELAHCGYGETEFGKREYSVWSSFLKKSVSTSYLLRDPHRLQVRSTHRFLFTEHSSLSRRALKILHLLLDRFLGHFHAISPCSPPLISPVQPFRPFPPYLPTTSRMIF